MTLSLPSTVPPPRPRLSAEVNLHPRGRVVRAYENPKCSGIGQVSPRPETRSRLSGGLTLKKMGRKISSSSVSRRATSSSSSSSSSKIISSSSMAVGVAARAAVGVVVMASTLALLTSIPGARAEGSEKEVTPVFLEPVPNVTVAVGRDASLTCAVDHLGQHKVAWIHLDRSMIVSIHNHVITRQPQFTVTYDSHKTWTLQVTGVSEQDRGHYLCQVNTVPMISQTGFLQVVVPPNIDDARSSQSHIVVREKENVTLKCTGRGFPVPQIKWRREDGKRIETSDGREVPQLDGEELPLRQVSRTHMGSYLCIATNGVPPSVSMRITLVVEFAPQMHVPNQLLGSPKGTDIRLECFVEAQPPAVTYWEFQDMMVMDTPRITTLNIHDRYKTHMVLDIKDLEESDFGMYKCISKNSIAETDGSITLNKTPPPTQPPVVKLQRGDGYDDSDLDTRGRSGRKEQHSWQELDEGRRDPHEDEHKPGEGEQRRVEEARRRAQDLERQRLEHELDRRHHNEHATRVTHEPASSAVSIWLDLSVVLTLVSSAMAAVWLWTK